MKRPLIAISLSFLLLTACKASVPADSATESHAPAEPTKSAPATPVAQPVASAVAIDAGFAKGMAYADLRKRVLAAGWLPVVDPACRENIGGEATICFDVPELEACSGDGHCNMHFADAASGREVAVHTYGPIERWNAPVDDKSLAVTGWEVSNVSAEKNAVACPSQDFDTFLKAFASDDKVRRAFTAPLVKVAELGGGETGDDTVMVYETAGAYGEFNVRYAGGKYHYVDSEGNVDADDLAVKSEPKGNGLMAVRYDYGMSEGNSYTFRLQDGCWWLSEDPEPPSP